MHRYIAVGILRAIISLFVVSVIVFVLVRLSGDPTDMMLSEVATKEDQAVLQAYLGLDRSWPEQYLMFASRASRGDFGRSVRFERPAVAIVLERFPATIQLVGVSFLLALLLSVPIGVYSAVRRGGALDYASRLFAGLGQAIPPFWLGLVLILGFGVYLRMLPTSGHGSPSHIVLPAITLGWFVSVGMMRLTRSSMLDVLGTEYIKLARIKGLPERQVIWKHAFKNAALPVLTFAAILVVNMINGAVVVETVFGWPGVGSLVIEAVNNRDYPVVQTAVLFVSAIFAVSSLLVDVLYGFLNPKLRVS